jgi:hypothetical protein
MTAVIQIFTAMNAILCSLPDGPPQYPWTCSGSRSRAREPFQMPQLHCWILRVCWRHNLFWPIVIAIGPGFAAVYYDHDVKSFADRGVCEQTLLGLEERARQAKDFMAAVTEAAGDHAKCRLSFCLHR